MPVRHRPTASVTDPPAARLSPGIPVSLPPPVSRETFRHNIPTPYLRAWKPARSFPSLRRDRSGFTPSVAHDQPERPKALLVCAGAVRHVRGTCGQLLHMHPRGQNGAQGAPRGPGDLRDCQRAQEALQWPWRLLLVIIQFRIKSASQRPGPGAWRRPTARPASGSGAGRKLVTAGPLGPLPPMRTSNFGDALTGPVVDGPSWRLRSRAQ